MRVSQVLLTTYLNLPLFSSNFFHSPQRRKKIADHSSLPPLFLSLKPLIFFFSFPLPMPCHCTRKSLFDFLL